MCLNGLKADCCPPPALLRRAAARVLQNSGARRRNAIRASGRLDTLSSSADLDQLRRAYEGTPAERAAYEVVGLGQAMCDFSGTVDQAFLDRHNLPCGSRRCALLCAMSDALCQLQAAAKVAPSEPVQAHPAKYTAMVHALKASCGCHCALLIVTPRLCLLRKQVRMAKRQLQLHNAPVTRSPPHHLLGVRRVIGVEERAKLLEELKVSGFEVRPVA
jgi:hypothetical protein